MTVHVQEQKKKSGVAVKDDDLVDNDDDDNDEEAVPYVAPHVPNPGPPSIRNADGTFNCNLADHRVNAGCTRSVTCRDVS